MTTTKHLGTKGPEVFPVALGCMGMGAGSWYGASDDSESIATIHEALERGVNLLDTGDFYGMGRNEMLIGKALAGGRRDRALLSVKCGAQIAPNGAFVGVDTSPAAVKTALSYTLARLGVEHVDIYRPAFDPSVPIEDTVGAVADMVRAGYVRYIALTEVSAETIRRAAKVHPVVDVQLEYSLVSRGPEEKGITPVLADLGIAMTAFGVLSRGLLTGSKPGAKDFRSHMPRFENAHENQGLIDVLAATAAKHGVTPAQLCVAWAIAKGRAQGVTIVPTMGMRTRKHLAETIGALDVNLEDGDIATLEAAIPPGAITGARYPREMMAALDSER